MTIWLLLPRERLLLERARPVTSAHGWSVDRGPDACTFYAWLSDHEVLCTHARSVTRTGFDGIDWDPAERWKPKDVPTLCFCRRDVGTGREEVLQGLTDSFHKTHGDIDGVSLSPDGRWLLWDGSADSTVCAAVDGSRCTRYRWPKGRAFESIWIGATGARWIEIEGDRGTAFRAAVHDEAHPGAKTPVSAPVSYAFGGGLPRTVAIDTVAGTALQAPIIWQRTNPEIPSSVNIAEYDLAKPKPAARILPQQLPARAKVLRLCLSPDGTRLASLVEIETPSPLAAWLHRLMPSYPAPPNKCLQLCVSRVDGGGMEVSGSLHSTGQDPDPWKLLDFDTLQWLPGGRKLSFVYGHDLRVVDAP